MDKSLICKSTLSVTVHATDFTSSLNALRNQTEEDTLQGNRLSSKTRIQHETKRKPTRLLNESFRRTRRIPQVEPSIYAELHKLIGKEATNTKQTP